MKYVPRFEDILLEEFAQNGRGNSTLRILTLFSTPIFSVSFFFIFQPGYTIGADFTCDWLNGDVVPHSAVCQKWGEILFHGFNELFMKKLNSESI